MPVLIATTKQMATKMQLPLTTAWEAVIVELHEHDIHGWILVIIILLIVLLLYPISIHLFIIIMIYSSKTIPASPTQDVATTLVTWLHLGLTDGQFNTAQAFTSQMETPCKQRMNAT
jgi:hypothetical protein